MWKKVLSATALCAAIALAPVAARAAAPGQSSGAAAMEDHHHHHHGGHHGHGCRHCGHEHQGRGQRAIPEQENKAAPPEAAPQGTQPSAPAPAR